MSIFSNTPFDPSTWNPATWQVPADIPSTFDDPTFPENRYQIAFTNQTPHVVILRCVAFNSRTNQWTGTWNDFWRLNPGQGLRLEYPSRQPLVGNFFRFAGLAEDSPFNWGDPQHPHETGVGPSYNTDGDFRLWDIELT
jgi:hypothetical protein